MTESGPPKIDPTSSQEVAVVVPENAPTLSHGAGPSSLSAPGPGIASASGRPAMHSEFITKSGRNSYEEEEENSAPCAAEFLRAALRSDDPEQKRRYAEDGLSNLELEEEDDELKALLLRQLYSVALEEGANEEAYEIASQMVALETLGDFARQDAARAALALGLLDEAMGHIRIAARVCPASRRAYHYAHLGALLRFEGRIEQAIQAFEKAGRWATEDRTLYQAQLALAECDSGTRPENLRELRQNLEAQVDRKAYALWVLGELCIKLGDHEKGRAYLESFLARQKSAPRAKSLSLSGEIAHVRALLDKITA